MDKKEVLFCILSSSCIVTEQGSLLIFTLYNACPSPWGYGFQSPFLNVWFVLYPWTLWEAGMSPCDWWKHQGLELLKWVTLPRACCSHFWATIWHSNCFLPRNTAFAEGTQQRGCSVPREQVGKADTRGSRGAWSWHQSWPFLQPLGAVERSTLRPGGWLHLSYSKQAPWTCKMGWMKRRSGKEQQVKPASRNWLKLKNCGKDR